MGADRQRRGDASYTRLRHLQAISEAALAHLHFDALVAELLGRLTAILETDTAAVLLLDPDTDELVARAARGLEEEVEAEVRIPLERGFAGRIAAERRPIVVPDVDDADIFNPILREKGLRSLLGVPLVVEGQVTGVLHVGTLTPRHFAPEDAELLQAAADRIALAIDHARLYEAERDARAAAERAAGELRRLQAITEAALAHLTLDDLLDVLLERVRDLISTDTAVLMLLEEDRAELVARASLGLDTGDERDRTVRVGDGFWGRIAAERRALVIERVEDSDLATPAIRAAGLASMLGVPLVAGGRMTGVLALGTFEQRRFPAADVDLLQRAGDRIALAIENGRLYEAERLARAAAEHTAEQIRRIESITEVALHHIALEDEVLAGLLARVRDVLETDTAALLVLDDSRQTLVARASTGLEEEVERDVEVPIGHGFAGRVAEQRAPITILDAGSVDLVSPLLRSSGVTSLAGVPLAVEDRLLGVLHVGTRAEREFSKEDMDLLELAGERLAVALDHSRLYEREHFVAETLQRSLLPEQLPELAGAELAARYVPGEGEAVGGDWYDVIPLRDGCVALAMGDVVSHGVRAASVMGQLRNALRAYALEGHEPVAVLHRLDGVARSLEGRELATLVYAVLDPGSCVLRYATAGHPPPVLLGPETGPALLEEGRGPPLGAVSDAIFTDAAVELRPGDTLLLYTDGIVERRDMWIDEGLDRLVEEARGVAHDDPDAVLERLTVALLGDAPPSDDVALLALRVDPAPAGPLRLTLPADPTALAAMRHSLRGWMAAAGLQGEGGYDVLVATTEAAANAVEHAYGPADATFEVEARAHHEGVVTVVVRDRGSWRPPRGHNRGRGTLLMQAMMDEFEVTTGEGGTEVRMSKRLLGEMAA